MSKKKNEDSKTTDPEFNCRICGEIGRSAFADQKTGWPEDDTFLPAAAAKLKTVRTLKDSGSRKKLVQQCPACKDYFIYELDYEFLAGGSEDEESLVRISKDELKKFR